MASSETPVWKTHETNLKTVTITYVAHTDGTVLGVSIVAGIQALYGWFLARVRTWPTAGGTAPDAADVTVKDENGYDLLEAGGVGLVHATAAQAVAPLIGGAIATQPIIGDLTVAVANQATNGATFNVALDFIR